MLSSLVRLSAASYRATGYPLCRFQAYIPAFQRRRYSSSKYRSIYSGLSRNRFVSVLSAIPGRHDDFRVGISHKDWRVGGYDKLAVLLHQLFCFPSSTRMCKAVIKVWCTEHGITIEQLIIAFIRFCACPKNYEAVREWFAAERV